MNNFPIATPRSITLLVSPAPAVQPLFDRIAQMALQGPVSVIDGGNVFQGYALARSLYRQAARPLAAAALQRVLLSRVFTCYQMATLLNEASCASRPLLALDFLATFYDQSVNAVERKRLLAMCIRRLKRLSQSLPVAIWVRQRAVIPEDALSFAQMLVDAAGKVWQPALIAAEAQPAVCQPALFTAG